MSGPSSLEALFCSVCSSCSFCLHGALLGIEGEQAVDVDLHAFEFRAFFDGVGVFTDEFHIEHGLVPVGSKKRAAVINGAALRLSRIYK